MTNTKIKRRADMGVINIRKLGLAFGATAALLYLGCAIVMSLAGREASIFLFNSMMHGIDISPIIRMKVPVSEMLIGIIEIFILGWLIGATIASIYNFSLKK